VAVTNQFGCTTLSNVFVYTSIHAVFNDNPYLQFFPNPTSGILYVQLKNEKNDDVESMKIFNLLGEEIFGINKSQFNKLHTIDLSNQPSGLYFVHTMLNRQLFIDKIIVSKL
jgi:hypothetical protein